MPTLPLFDASNQSPEGSRQVISPGGYEWWRLDAEDGPIRFSADFLRGNPFDPNYLRACRDYLHSPTRHAPPSPGNFPALRLQVSIGDQSIGYEFRQFNPEEFHASGESINVTLGANRIDSNKLHITGEFTAELEYSSAISLPAKTINASKHFWNILSPLGKVTGQIRVGKRTIEMRGAGCRQYRFGLSPLAATFTRWATCRIFTENTSALAEFSLKGDDLDQATCRGMIFANRNFTPLDSSPQIKWNRRVSGPWHPETVNVAHQLTLRNPKIVRKSGFDMTILYEAFLNGQSAMAICEIIDFGRMA